MLCKQVYLQPKSILFNKGKTVNKFIIKSNTFLKTDVKGFYNTHYVGYRRFNNPDFLNTLKNTYDSYSESSLNNAENEVKHILSEDLPSVLNNNEISEAAVCVIPRSKSYDSYSPNQLRFVRAVKESVSKNSQLIDGTEWIKRKVNTKTTHLDGRNVPNYCNDGPRPYSGITKDTCHFSEEIVGKDIILVDDIYTNHVNIDEDAIQALIEVGAKSVVLYVVAKTQSYSH